MPFHVLLIIKEELGFNLGLKDFALFQPPSFPLVINVYNCVWLFPSLHAETKQRGSYWTMSRVSPLHQVNDLYLQGWAGVFLTCQVEL